jgi:hypothetical protein
VSILTDILGAALEILTLAPTMKVEETMKQPTDDSMRVESLSNRLEGAISYFRDKASPSLLRKTDETIKHVEDAIESLNVIARDLL